MAVELKVPSLGESVTEVEIGDWLKSQGEKVQEDEPVVVLESEKATVELPAPITGIVSKVLKKKGETASIGEVIGYMEESAEAAAEEEGKKAKPREEAEEAPKEKAGKAEPQLRVMPAARRELAAQGLKAEEVRATGPGGRLLKEDVVRHAERREAEKAPPVEAPGRAPRPAAEEREEEAVPMSLLRRRIAARLLEAQRNQALLTTFNEIDMSAVKALREEHGKTFEEKYHIRLGIMSFFVKACVDALKLIPQVNAEIRGNDVIYRNYYDIGVAVGGGRGLVVPVLKSAERMSFAEIEAAIHDFARRARENRLKPEELQGGTFTISNGGVYGSLLSTPIINPPQSGILGMHAIQERPVVRDGQIVVRPMMYVALTYDHRIVDGREAVTFLKRIKECIESPSRILLEI